MSQPSDPTWAETFASDFIAGDFEGHFFGRASSLNDGAVLFEGQRRFDVQLLRGVLKNVREVHEIPALVDSSPHGPSPIRQGHLYPLWIDIGRRGEDGLPVDVWEIGVRNVVLFEWSAEHVVDRESSTSGLIKGTLYAVIEREVIREQPLAAAAGCRSALTGCSPPGCLTVFLPTRLRAGCLSLISRGGGCGCGALLAMLLLLLPLSRCDRCASTFADQRQRLTDKVAIDRDAELVSASTQGAQKRISIDEALKDPSAFFAQCDVPIYQSGDLLFDFDKAELRPEAMPQMRKLGRLVRMSKTPVRLRIEGHTDPIGTDEYNTALSTRRAESVAQWLNDTHALSSSRVEIKGIGRTKPLVDARGDPSLQRLNRRVEIFTSCEPAKVQQ